ncbi:MAG: SDR family oxidoreductase [Planctomycetota bacterium]
MSEAKNGASGFERELAGRVALVTGASSGIGRATAKLFSARGARVVLTGRDQARLEAIRSELGSDSIALAADIADASAVAPLVSAASEQWGRLDVVVHAAGILRGGTLEATSLMDWDDHFAINVRSGFLLMQASLPVLKVTSGNIVLVSSVTGSRSFPGVLAYCTSKAAVDQLTRCAALELAPQGVRVNAVSPGVVKTGLHRNGGMEEAAYAKFLEHSRSTHPLGRVGEPEEVAEAIAFLASDRASWITGVTLPIDGGRAQTCAR